jgi:hypothetical protein
MLNQQTNYSGEMSEIQWPHTLHISLNQEKPDGSIWADELQRLVLKYRMFQFLLASFQRLVFGGQV